MTRRGLITFLGLLAVYIAFFWALIGRTPARADAPSPFPRGSSFGRSAEGSALAAAYLRERGHKVQPLLTSSLTDVPASSVILVIDPPHFPKGVVDSRPLLTVEEERFVRNGGRVVLALSGSVPSIELKDLAAATSWERVHPDWPAVQRLDPGGAHRFLAGPWLRDAYTVFTASDLPVVARRSMGRGDVVAVASASILENSHLDRANNLEFLDSLVAGRAAVYFDETAHGLGASLGVIDLLGQWNLMPFLLALLAVSIAVLLRRNRGLGPPDRDEAGPPADAVDLVEALGRLYARSLRDEEALGLHRDHLRQVVSEKTGLRGQALRARVDSLLAIAGPRPRTAVAFEQELGAINRALRRAHEHPR